ncbi:MAG: tetratricopeptide repeat protein [Candidatus Omnitrophota bacterium]
MAKKNKKANNDSLPAAPGRTRIAYVSEAMRRYPWAWAWPLIALITLFVYSPFYSATLFISHENSILRLPLLSHARNIPQIFSRDFLLYTDGQYRPLSYAVIALARTWVAADWTIFWNLWMAGFHIVNACLLFSILRWYTPKISTALITALVFALHPLSAETVDNINHYPILLSLTLILSSLRCYLAYSNTKKRGWFAAALAFYLPALFCARPAFTLGFILLINELFILPSAGKKRLYRIAPFCLLPLLLSPAWLTLNPHPLHYRYIPLEGSSLWDGLFTVIGGTGVYLRGLLLSSGIPGFLHETVEKVFSWRHPLLIFWGIFHIAALSAILWLLKRRSLAAFGLSIMYIGLLPYASVAYNRVTDYIAWSYFYLPLVGWSIMIGGLFGALFNRKRKEIAAAGQIAMLALVVVWSGWSLHINSLTRHPIEYWNRIFEKDSRCKSVLIELGQSLLAKNNLSSALHDLFSPYVEDVREPCLLMARYYNAVGERLAAAIHLRFCIGMKSAGLVFGRESMAAADLLLSAGALDHAEDHLGKVLMVDPANASAMVRLAKIWLLKGRVMEAKQLARQIANLAPDFEEGLRLDQEIRQFEQKNQDKTMMYMINAPSPDWLNYVLDQERSPSLRREIISLSQRADPNDAIICMEAVIALLENEDYAEAAKKAKLIAQSLPNYPMALAVACAALAAGGESKEAIPYGYRAVSLSNRKPFAWQSLAMAYALKGELDESDQPFIQAIESDPSLASQFYYNLGLQKQKEGKIAEAIASLEKSVKASPNNLQAQQALGKASLYAQNSSGAIEKLLLSLKTKPDDASTLADLGRAYMKENQIENGVRSFQTAVKIEPENALYHYYLGSAYNRNQQKKEALHEFRIAVQLKPDDVEVRFALANTLFAAQEYSEASEHYRIVVRQKPDYPYVHANLGTIFQTQNKLDEAIQEYREEIRYYPKFADIYNRIIRICLQKGDRPNALETERQAKELGLELSQDIIAKLHETAAKE